jgi:hypothetical protein
VYDAGSAGLILQSSFALSVTNCVFTNNSVELDMNQVALLPTASGGAIAIQNSFDLGTAFGRQVPSRIVLSALDVTVSGCSFVNNTASGTLAFGGALAVLSSGVSTDNMPNTVVFASNNVSFNRVVYTAPVASAGGGAIGILTSGSPAVATVTSYRDSVFRNNSASLLSAAAPVGTSGGGAVLESGGQFRNCQFVGNSVRAGMFGAAVNTAGSVFQQCVLEGNHCHGDTRMAGSVLYANAGAISFTNNTVLVSLSLSLCFEIVPASLTSAVVGDSGWATR